MFSAAAAEISAEFWSKADGLHTNQANGISGRLHSGIQILRMLRQLGSQTQARGSRDLEDDEDLARLETVASN